MGVQFLNGSQVSQSQTKMTKPKNEDNGIASKHVDQDNDDITENGEEAKIIEEETYDQEEKYEYPSYRLNGLSGNIIKNKYQADQ